MQVRVRGFLARGAGEERHDVVVKCLLCVHNLALFCFRYRITIIGLPFIHVNLDSLLRHLSGSCCWSRSTLV